MAPVQPLYLYEQWCVPPSIFLQSPPTLYFLQSSDHTQADGTFILHAHPYTFWDMTPWPFFFAHVKIPIYFNIYTSRHNSINIRQKVLKLNFFRILTSIPWRLAHKFWVLIPMGKSYGLKRVEIEGPKNWSQKKLDLSLLHQFCSNTFTQIWFGKPFTRPFQKSNFYL